MIQPARAELEHIEMDLLLEAIWRAYGFDFRDYQSSSLRRRLREFARTERLPNLSALQDRVLHDRTAMARLVGQICVRVTEMFRDPGFFAALKVHVLPDLRHAPFFRVWHAGCSTGEEVYSMAILLHEAGLLEKCRIYATDIDQEALNRAQQGIYPLAQMQRFTANYHRAGGQRSFSDYYTAGYDRAAFHPFLKRNLVWGMHNLVTDSSFNAFQLILCRNVLIYFNPTLQRRVLSVLHQSLSAMGVLSLGRHESLRCMPYEENYRILDEPHKLYQKHG